MRPQLLDGTIIRPGEAFSLNEALGKRTVERGFVAAPQIFDGRLEDAVGGGISQVATTLYNAAFFAGVKLVAHQAHQFYISRYPMGREATVSWGGPELVFRNDWPAAILMKVTATDSAITVRFYSRKLGRRVETTTGEPYSQVAPRTITSSNPSLPPGTTSTLQSAGASGFTVQYTRKVFKGPKLLANERYTVRYDPQNAIVEMGPPKPRQAEAEAEAEAGAGDARAGGRTNRSRRAAHHGTAPARAPSSALQRRSSISASEASWSTCSVVCVMPNRSASTRSMSCRRPWQSSPRPTKHVRGERVEAGGDSPDVQVVHARHAGHLDDRARDLIGVDPRRRLLHQDRRRVAEHAPRARDDQQRDRERDDRVDRRPAGQQDHERRREDADRAEDVGDDVAERRLDVQALRWPSASGSRPRRR